MRMVVATVVMPATASPSMSMGVRVPRLAFVMVAGTMVMIVRVIMVMVVRVIMFVSMPVMAAALRRFFRRSRVRAVAATVPLMAALALAMVVIVAVVVPFTADVFRIPSEEIENSQNH